MHLLRLVLNVLLNVLCIDRWSPFFNPHARRDNVDVLHHTDVAASFRDPPVAYRARLRYWLPDAHVCLDQVYDDIAQAGARGAAGVELLGFYLYGAEPGTPVPTDWSEYGWGTPAWKRVLDTAIRAHRDHGLLLDVAMGPNQGQGVPAHEDDPGLLWDLVPHHAIVRGGRGTPRVGFHGTVPGWGTGELLAVVTAQITNTTTMTTSTTGRPQSHRGHWDSDTQAQTTTQYTLAERSLVDVTPRVREDGWLDVDLTADTDDTDAHHIVFAVYQVRSGARTQQPPGAVAGPQTPPPDYVHNGSWTVDHFSAAGARVMAAFWEQHLLANGTREQLRQVARCAWEDSVEINPNVYWTPSLPAAFARRHGYALAAYYPLLFHDNSLTNHFADRFVTDEPDAGHSHVAAYRMVLADKYAEYLDALRAWANRELGVAWSAQIGYNMAVDMPSLVAKADIPECEDLAFGSNIDAYRQFSAPALWAGRPVVSAEVGAQLGQAFQMTLPRWLPLLHRLFAGGVNAVVLHGLPYSGAYPSTTWPGYVPFTYAWSDMLGRQQPAWDHIKEPFFDYLARTMYLLQQGIPRLDVAFYQHRTSYKRPATGYEPGDLLAAGYTYGYLDPQTLASSGDGGGGAAGAAAVVKDGVLAPDRQAYKALLVRGSDTIPTVQAADTLAQHAHAGLPVVFAGGLPSFLGGPRGHHNAAARAYVHQTLHALRHLPNVHFVAREDGLAEVLRSIGVTPRTEILSSSSSSSHWWPVWRQTADKRAHYAMLYHDGEARSSVSVAFASTGRPYRYDASSGAVTPINVYSRTANTTVLRFEMAPHQAVLVGFHDDEPPAWHATSASAGVLDVRSTDGGGLAAIVRSLAAHNSHPERAWVETSDGAVHRMPAVEAAPLTLHDWILVVEHWDPPDELSNSAAASAVRWNSSHRLDRLVSWQHIPGLQHVSGRGYYATTFAWPGSRDGHGDGHGALLSLGPVVHTMAVSVNGHALPPLDAMAPATLDISPYLVAGGQSNTVEVVVSTTLANRMAPIWDTLRTSGAPPTGLFGAPTKPPGDADSGLLGPVQVIPYRVVSLREQAETGLVKQAG
ncbi:hypothetical protein SCUCBS95973_001417 [Sporothrix curviconia]|uniref:Secreted protein n=1 Tax=Sporothrix curviconia TaxID=1260050 RepID=A0ABP0AYZ1_9PEZI